MTERCSTIFTTGGGSGIGRALAEVLAAEGHGVIIGGRRRETLDAVVVANQNVSAIELDVTDPGAIAAAASQLVREFPELNVLINNAGTMKIDHLRDGDPSIAEITIATNLLGLKDKSNCKIVVAAVKPLRFAEANGNYAEMFGKNNAIVA